MNAKSFLLSAAWLAMAAAPVSAAAAAGNSAPTPPAQAGSTTTIEPNSRVNQNPYVNPNAAGTQLGRPNMAAPGVAPGPGREPGSGSGQALGRGERNSISAAQAEGNIASRGYDRISGLRQNTDKQVWEAQAYKNGRLVHLTVDPLGNVVEAR